jgi:nitrate/TMAO reductase-like tetraheme cytochrome c subunit
MVGIGLVLVVVLVMVIATLSWSHTRFTRISGCTVCHEIFVNESEYAPYGELSSSVEDFKPVAAFDPGHFNVTVGCGECHAYPYNEYLESPHYDNDLGVRPGCVGCHDPHSLAQIVKWKFFYVNTGGVGESPFHAISSSMRDIPAWEELRIDLAKNVRNTMIEQKSEKCKACHKIESEWFNDIKRHKSMLETNEKSCIHCHYNLVHGDVDWDDSHK